MAMENRLNITCILFFAFFFDSTHSEQALTTCGSPNRNSGFIVHGDHFKRGDYPWIVALLYTGFSPPSYFCGGTLISTKHVVTGRKTKVTPYQVHEFKYFSSCALLETEIR